MLHRKGELFIISFPRNNPARRELQSGDIDQMNKAEQKQYREDTIERLVVLEHLSESDARMLVDVIGVDWASLKREADLMKRKAQ